VDFIEQWHEDSGFSIKFFLQNLGLRKGKYHSWRNRYGKSNEHNGKIPRDFWLTPQERQSIISYYKQHPQEGYRRLCYMMMDENIVAVSPSTTYRVLSEEGLLKRFNGRPSKKGTGFIQPSKPHEHWHIDISYINICGTFYYLTSILDGYSRAILHWELREQMTTDDIEIITQRCKEFHPEAHKSRIISDNGPQFISKDFKEFIRISGMTHVRTSPYYPQSNGKLERYHGTMKQECIRQKTPLTLEEGRKALKEFVEHYNTKRLHSALSYVTPHDVMNGRQAKILAAREAKLDAARSERKLIRQHMRLAA